jgi:hypothetical protein
MDMRLLPYKPDRDVYRLLGVAPSAGRVEIVAACRELARAFHPDRNESRRATEEMQVVNAVRSLLTDPRSRAEYDRSRVSFLTTPARPRAARPLVDRPVRPVRPARAARPAAPERPAKPSIVERARVPVVSRTARAAMAGLLTALRSLPPTRCDYCKEWVEPDHRFCGACGASLPTAIPLSAKRSG